ncbi:unnamed protein product [Diplocarpon coronariae]
MTAHTRARVITTDRARSAQEQHERQPGSQRFSRNQVFVKAVACVSTDQWGRSQQSGRPKWYIQLDGDDAAAGWRELRRRNNDGGGGLSLVAEIMRSGILEVWKYFARNDMMVVRAMYEDPSGSNRQPRWHSPSFPGSLPVVEGKDTFGLQLQRLNLSCRDSVLPKCRALHDIHYGRVRLHLPHAQYVEFTLWKTRPRLYLQVSVGSILRTVRRTRQRGRCELHAPSREDKQEIDPLATLGTAYTHASIEASFSGQFPKLLKLAAETLRCCVRLDNGQSLYLQRCSNIPDYDRARQVILVMRPRYIVPGTGGGCCDLINERINAIRIDPFLQFQFLRMFELFRLGSLLPERLPRTRITEPEVSGNLLPKPDLLQGGTQEEFKSLRTKTGRLQCPDGGCSRVSNRHAINSRPGNMTAPKSEEYLQERRTAGNGESRTGNGSRTQKRCP